MSRHSLTSWRFLAAGILLSFLIAGCTADEQSTQSRTEATAEGRAAYEAGDYKTAYEELRPVAEAGDPLSQYYIARIYHFGEGRERDIDKAIKWYERSAEAGAKLAQYNLGIIYITLSDYRDYDAAKSWFNKAAHQGYSKAQYNLSQLYHEEKNYKEAIKWTKRAAEEGMREAEFALGSYFDQGIGVEQNSKKALSYYELAASKKYGPAMINLAFMYSEGKGVERDLRHVYKWSLLASEQGMTRADSELEELERRLDDKSLGEASAMADEWRQTHLKR